MIYLVAGVCILAGAAFVIGRLRSVQLKRMAYTLGLRYDSTLDTLLTEDAASQFYFLRLGKHHFYQVLTFRDSTAFMRVCTDRISPAQGSAHTYTLVSAELTRGTFIPLILTLRPTNEPMPSHPALPPELASRYVLSAPDSFVFPPAVTGFLKSAKPCYLELTKTALIYHEFDQKPVSQIQPMRYRALQLLKAFVHEPEKMPSASPAFSSLTQTNLDTTLLLKLQTGSAAYTQAAIRPSGSSKWIFGVIFIITLLGLCLFAGYALKYWIPH